MERPATAPRLRGPSVGGGTCIEVAIGDACARINGIPDEALLRPVFLSLRP